MAELSGSCILLSVNCFIFDSPETLLKFSRSAAFHTIFVLSIRKKSMQGGSTIGMIKHLS